MIDFLSECFVINVEGLDVSGKETFCSNLKKFLDERKEMFVRECEVIVQDAPDYEEDVTKNFIKPILMTPLDTRNTDALDMAFALDRAYSTMRLQKRIYENATSGIKTIVILDRYYLSNLIYSIGADVHSGKLDLDSVNFEDLDSLNALKLAKTESKRLLRPDILVMFKRGSEASIELHNSLIAEKPNKDLNETVAFQETLNTVMDKIMVSLPKLMPATLIKRVDIGSNFDNQDLERSILDNMINIYGN